MSGTLKKDDNGYPVSGGVSSADADVVLPLKVNSSTGRLLVDSAAGSGTVTSVSVVSANGFAGSVATATTTPAITITTTINSPVLAGNGTAISAATTTGTGSTVVLQGSPTLTTPVIGAATGTSLSVSGSLSSATSLILEETGAGTDTITIQAPASIAASYVLTLPVDDGGASQFLQTDGSGVLSWAAASAAAGGSNTQVQYNNAAALGGITGVTSNGTIMSFAVNSASFTGSTSGTTLLNATAIAGSTTLTLPAATDTLVGKATTDTFTNKTFDVDGTGNVLSNVANANIKAAAAIAVNKLAALTASRAVVTDGSGFVSAATTTATQIGYLSAATGTTGTTSTNVVFSTSPTFITPVLGAATATSVNGLIISTTTGTLTMTNGKTLAVTNTLTLSGTDSTVMTFPSTSDTVVTLAATQTLTNKRITPRVLSAASYTTDTGSSINGDTQDMFIVTAQTGALKFNNPSGTPTDGQKLILTVASSTTAARALTWDTAYGSTTVTLPTTTAATTVTLSIGFIWSASKTLWQCVAVA